MVLVAFGLVAAATVYYFTTFAQLIIRGKVFSKEFMAQFDEEHKKAFGKNAPAHGYPDDGNGYYSRKLDYLQWYTFNNWQRTQMNFLETFAPLFALTFITGVNEPLWAAVSIFAVAFGRMIYGIGYCNCGPKGRMLGALTFDLGLLSLLIGACVSLAKWNSETDVASARIFPVDSTKFKQLFPTA